VHLCSGFAKRFVVIFRQGSRQLIETDKQHRETAEWARRQNGAGRVTSAFAC